MPEELIKPVGELTRVNPKQNASMVKPVGELTLVGKAKTPLLREWDNKLSPEQDVESAVAFLKNQYNNGNTNDSDFENLRTTLSDKRATEQQRKDAITAIQQKSMNNQKYYFEHQDNGVVVPKTLKYGELPKNIEDLQSYIGDKKQAKDDNFITDIVKHAYNILPNLAEDLVDLAQIGYEGVMDKQSANLNELKKSANFLKLKTDEDLEGGILKTDKIKDYTDIIKKENWDLSPNKIWGLGLELGQVLGEIAVPAGAVAEGVKGAKWVSKVGANGEKVLSTAGKIATAGAASFYITAPDVAESAREAGLEGRDVAAFTIPVSLAVSSLDVGFGLPGGLAKIIGAKAVNKEAEKNFFINTAKEFIKKNADGTVTKESLDKAISETIKRYPKEVGGLVNGTLKTAGEQGLEESGQAFIQRGGEQIYDKITPEEKAKFGTDVFSPESVADYIANFSTALGSLPHSAMINSSKKSEKEKYLKQSQAVFNVIQQGEAATEALIKNVELAATNGDLTEQERDNAIFKVKAYSEYNNQTKDLDLDDKEKKDAFELSFNIEALKSEIPTNKEELDTLDPIAIAKIDNKKEVVKGLQKQLNDMLLPKTVERETKVGQKTAETIVKNEENKKTKPSAAELLAKMGGIKAVEGDVDLEEEEDVPSAQNDREADYNQSSDKFNQMAWEKPTRIKAAVQEKLKFTPKNEMDVTIREAQNGRYTFDIGDNKNVWFAQSVKGDKDNYFKHENLPATRIESEDKGGDADQNNETLKIGYYKEPAVVKRVEFEGEDRNGEPIVKAVLPVYNKESGKFIGFAKEHRVGKSFYTDDEKVHLNKIINSNLYSEDLNEYVHDTNRVIKPKVKKAVVETKVEPVKEVDFDKLAKKAVNEKELDVIIDQADAAEFPIDFDAVNERRKKLREVEKEKTKVEKKKEAEKQEDKKKAFVRPNVEAVPTKLFLNDTQKKSLIESGYDNATIDKAIKETDRILNLPTYEAFLELKNKGIFNLGIGEKAEYRPDLGMDKDQYNNTLKQLEEGKLTKTVEKLLDFVDGIKKTGEVVSIGLTGGKSIKVRIPLYLNILGEKSNSEFGLTQEEEEAELEKESLREQAFAETGRLQKESKSESKEIQKVVDRIQKSLPKFKVSYDGKLKAAGKIQGENITINPYYASTDTPIHEAGHALIDFIGYNNKAIQNGIEQLKSTPLWKEVKERYPELSEEMLGKEVLAEAIGREGADIFDTEVQKIKLKQVLDYIFDWLKSKLGLEKNVAKSLARQIISGIGTKSIDIKVDEQLQKPKKYKELDELTQSELQRKITKSFEDYRQNVLGRNLEDIREAMQQAKDGLKDSESTDQDVLDYKAVIDILNLQNKRDKYKWMAYKEDLSVLKSFQSEKPISKMTDEELISFYNLAESANYQDAAKEDIVKKLKEEIGIRLFNDGAAIHEGEAYFDKEIASKRDLKAKDIDMKNLAHMPEYVPDLQSLSKLYENASMDKIIERADEHKILKKLADSVIREYQKKVGLKQSVSDFVFSDNAKVFDFVEHPDGRYYTIEEAKAKGYSEAKINYLKYMLHLNELKKEQLDGQDVSDQVLKVDKKASEAFRTEGVIQGMSAYLGNSYNIRNVRIKQDGIPKSYGEIEQSLINKAKNGTLSKLAAIAELIKYNYAARKQLSKGVNVDEATNQLKPSEASEYKLSTDGRLKSKFKTKRANDRGYSKDHYRAAHEFINDYTHVKHMGKILPYVNAIHQINSHGVTSSLSGEKIHEKKENVVEWLKQWSDLHLFKSPKKSKLDPKLETALRTLRKLSSLSTMFFAPTAAAWNVFTGTYNNFRKESGKALAIGSARLAKDWMRGGKNKDILDMFDVVSVDQDSNPKIWGGQLLNRIGYSFNQLAETFNQGSMFLGLMTQDEIDSLEYTTDKYGVKKLDFKKGMSEADKKAFRTKMNSYDRRVSDIHGKYAKKDLRNFMNGEFGKAIAQYRVWVPDWWMQRFGDRYYDNEGVEHIGSYRAMFGQGMSELLEQIKTQGLSKGLINNDSAEAKSFRSNLKGAMVIASLMTLSLGASDDDDDKELADNIDKALGQILFVFDPNQDKFMTSNPVAALGAANKLFNVLNEVKDGKLDKAGKDATKLIPYNKVFNETESFLEED